MTTKPRVRIKAASRPHLTVVPFARPADPDVLHVLGQFDSFARSGYITGIAVAAVGSDGAVHTAYTQGDNIFTLIGALNHVTRRVQQGVATS